MSNINFVCKECGIINYNILVCGDEEELSLRCEICGHETMVKVKE